MPAATKPAPHPLDSFFSPSSIALIGASRDLEKIPGRLLSMLRKNQYPGRIYPVNPNYGELDGLKCYPSIDDVGAPIDLAIVIIPARAVLGALEQCAAAGVKNAVIISSGFAEEGGDSAAMQDAIVALAKRTGMRISGPNAEGFYSEAQRVAATFSPTVDVKPNETRLIASSRRIGLVAQSGRTTQAGDRDQGRPLRRRRAGCGLAHRQHGRLVGGLRRGVRKIRIHCLQRPGRSGHHRRAPYQQPLAKGRPRLGSHGF